MLQRRLWAGGFLAGTLLVSGCISTAPKILVPRKVEAFCGSRQARLTAVASVVTSTNDVILDDHPTDVDVHRELRQRDGVLVRWNDQLLALPTSSAQLGETDGYARIRAAAIATAPQGSATRHIFLELRDHGTYRWVTMQAFDVQNVCVEGKPQT